MSVKDFYKTTTWQRCRAYIMSRDQGLCQDCLKSGRITAAEEVHHIIELTPENVTDPDIATNPDNLIPFAVNATKQDTVQGIDDIN